jgi:DNA polymerase-3 subunit alpha
VFEIVKAGGLIMVPLIISSIIAFAIVLERFWTLKKEKVVPQKIIDDMHNAIKRNAVDDKFLAKMRLDSPLGKVLAAGLDKRHSSREQVKESLQEAGNHVSHELETFLNALGTVAAITPLIGLLGTVVGMIAVFTTITTAGVGDPSELAGGISTALITTATGLTIAIPSLIFHRHFKAKIETFIIKMEQEALKLVEKRHGKRINFVEEDINDREVYEYISTGDTLGLFQIESAGMQDLAKKLKPNGFEDIIAMLALYRPGPMEAGMLDDFVERKHGRQEITYAFAELEPILKPTYGVIVYQEQVMQIVQTIGGFSLGGADLVRRAMGKKIKEEMDKLQGEFADGAVKKGFDRQKAFDLFDLIVKFAGYGFNKSHSAAYAMITFYTSYLKHYYPTEFMAAILTLEKNNTDKVVKYVDEVKKMGMKLLPPDINKSGLVFEAINIEGEEVVMFGMGALKGAGEIAINSMITARGDEEFKDISDFVSRIDSSKVNKRVIEALVKAGAFDSFGHSRKALLFQLEDIIDMAKKAGEARKQAINSLWGDDEEMTTVTLEIKDSEEYEPMEILEMEKDSLGFYVSGHPLDKYRETLDSINYTLSSEIDDLADGSQAMFIGKIESISEKISKKGNKFGIANIMDLHGNIELMLFENRLKELEEDFDLNKPIAFKVKITKDRDFVRMNILKISNIKEAKKTKIKVEKEVKIVEEKPQIPLVLMMNLMPDAILLEKFVLLLESHRGKRPLELHIKSKLADVIIESKICVSESILEEAKALGIYREEGLVVEG